MWNNDKNFPARGFLTPPPTRKPSPMMPMSERKGSSPANNDDFFHVLHKVPAGDSPYVRAKHIQLIDKDPSRAVSLFWAAINAGDRVDSALKDMSIVMKQLDRSDEAIEAIKSFRHLCPHDSQDSLDNVLIELYKRSGRIEEEIQMLQLKLKRIENGVAFGGRKTKTARSQGKKVQITLEEEISRILGNLAWAYMQQNKYERAEEHYRKALSLEPDKNKQCNLAICLMHMNRIAEAKSLLHAVRYSSGNRPMNESYAKSFERALQMLTDLESHLVPNPIVEKKGNQNEIQTPFASLINRNSKEVGSFISGGQHYGSAFTVSRSRTDGHDDKTVQSDEHRRVSYHQNHIWRGNRTPRSISFGPRSSLQSSPQTKSVETWKKGTRYENSGESMSGFATKQKGNWVGSTGTEANPAWKNTYSSPTTAGSNLDVLFTQPRRSSWGFNSEHQRRKLLGDDAVCCSSRKLSFEPPITTENMQQQAIQDVNGDLLAPSSPANGNWRRSCRDLARLEDQSMVIDNTRILESSVDQEQDQGSGSNNVSGSGKPMTTCEECFRKNSPGSSDGLHQPTAENSHDNHKKSWADMVEEEEQELLSERTLTDFYEDWNGEEEFNDENLNANIIFQSPCPQSQIKKPFDLKDGSGSVGASVSSRNLAVQRSLCFNQQQKPESTDYFFSSPFAKKALNLDGYNSVEANGRDSMSSGNKKLRRRNRLQVFQGITLHSESP